MTAQPTCLPFVVAAAAAVKSLAHYFRTSGRHRSCGKGDDARAETTKHPRKTRRVAGNVVELGWALSRRRRRRLRRRRSLGNCQLAGWKASRPKRQSHRKCAAPPVPDWSGHPHFLLPLPLPLPLLPLMPLFRRGSPSAAPPPCRASLCLAVPPEMSPHREARAEASPGGVWHHHGGLTARGWV